MSLHYVFELIRKEDAVFWIGAGFSKYAGYPLGGELSTIIYDSLSIEEKKSILKGLPLPELCEAYVCARSRNQLIQLLRKIFDKQPASLEHHKRLAQIPLVKTIVTTNYDNLFENAFGVEVQVVLNNIDTSYIDDDKLALFKAHGDLTNPNSIVITNSDYNTALNQETQKSSYWSCIKSRIVNKAVIMLGYSLSDPNIELIFNQIDKELQGNRREIYLLAPGFDKSQRKRLETLGVKYIDMKGEVFVRKLQQNVYDNIINDFNSGNLSSETLGKILLKKNLAPVLEITSEGKWKIRSIRPIKGKTKINLTFKANPNDKNLQDFDNFIKGKAFGQVEVDSNKFKDFKFTISDINLLPISDDGLKFSITSLPTEKGTLDAYFEDGFELNNVEYEIFKSAYRFEAVCTYKSSQLKVVYSFGDNPNRALSFKYDQLGDFESVKVAIECNDFLCRLFKGLPLTIYSKVRNQSISWTPPPNNDLLAETEVYLEYFNLLKQIELQFKVRFTNIGTPKQEYFDRMQYLIAWTKPAFGYIVEEMTFEIVGNKNDVIQKLRAVHEKNENLEVEFNNREEYEVHGKVLTLGSRVIEFYKPIILNFDKLILEEENIVKVKTQEKIKVIYRN